ncbi:MAG: DUF3800 domain-containing protein [Nitrososphaerales archaeon]|nr:DUF3800 domain-containing protein [Nitrososphaerales archaeon]
MQILYIDASGDPGMYDHKNSKFYILGGVALSENDWPITSAYFNDLCKKYFPKEDLEEIHTKQLFNGRSLFDKIDHKAMVADVCNFIATAHLTLFGIAIDKDQFLIRGLGKPEDVVNRSLEEIINRFHIFLLNRRERGIIVSDASAEGFDTRIRTLYEYFRKKGTHFWTLTKIIDTIFFTPSQTAMGIQLADFVAYAIKRKCVDGDSSLFDQFAARFGEHNFRLIPDPNRK